MFHWSRIVIAATKVRLLMMIPMALSSRWARFPSWFVVCVLFFAPCAVRADDTVTVTILYTAGNKGYFLPFKVYESRIFKGLTLKPGDRYGGYAVLAHYVKEARAQALRRKGILVLVDGGNSLVGSSEANFFKGNVSVDFMNRVGYDAITVSNLDFSLGRDVVEACAGKATFPFLNANLFETRTEQPPSFLKRHTLIEREGVKIGIVGYAQSNMRGWLDPRTIAGLAARPAAPLVQRCVDELRAAGAELVVAVDHTAGENMKAIAANVRGIDVLIDGAVEWASVYTTTFSLGAPEQIGNTVIYPEVDAHFGIGRIDLVIDRGTRRIVSRKSEIRFLNLAEDAEDPAMKNFVAKYSEIYFDVIGNKLEEVIGYATADLTTEWDEAWTTPLGTLVCDALRERAGTDFGIQNVGGIRRYIRKGPIRIADVRDALPFENTIVTFEVLGRDLDELYALRLIAPTKPAVPWIYVSGATLERDSGLAVRRVRILGKNPEPDRVYTFATNSYFHAAGYLIDARCRNIKVLDIPVADAVADYVRGHSPLSPTGREVGTHYEH